MSLHRMVTVTALALFLAIIAPQAALAYEDFHPIDPRTGGSAYWAQPRYRARHQNDSRGYYGGRSVQRGGGYGQYNGGGSYGSGYDYNSPSRGEMRRQDRVQEAAGIINGVPLSPAAQDAVEDRLLELIGAHPKKPQPTVSREETKSYLEFLRWKAQQKKKHKKEFEEE